MIRLSLLIPTVHGREAMYERLIKRINELGQGYPFEIVTLKDKKGESSIGEKRNKLREMSKGDYIAFIDDDDMILDQYFVGAFRAIDAGADVMGMIGTMTTNGGYPKTFEHSIMHDHYYQQSGIYYRPPNHLNPMKKSLSMQIDFPLISMGEDTNFAMRLCQAGLLNSEDFCMQPVYRYDFVQNKKY